MWRRFWTIAIVVSVVVTATGPAAWAGPVRIDADSPAARAGLEIEPNGLAQRAGLEIEPNGLAQRGGLDIEPNG